MPTVKVFWQHFVGTTGLLMLVLQLKFYNAVLTAARDEATTKQMMGDFLIARPTPWEPPFTCTGFDFFGPFYIKRR